MQQHNQQLEAEIQRLRLHLDFTRARDKFLLQVRVAVRQESKPNLKYYLMAFLDELNREKYPLPDDALQKLDLVIKGWRVVKQCESLERIGIAFNQLIEVLLESLNNEQNDYVMCQGAIAP